MFSNRGQELDTPISLKTHKIGDAVKKKNEAWNEVQMTSIDIAVGSPGPPLPALDWNTSEFVVWTDQPTRVLVCTNPILTIIVVKLVVIVEQFQNGGAVTTKTTR